MPDPLTFHLAACLYPGGLLDRSARPSPGSPNLPVNAPGPADLALRRLRQQRQALGFKTPVLLAGDQIYVDATAGLFDPSLRDQPFTRAYDRLRDQPWRNEALMRTTPLTLMDDHEVADNWEPSLNRGRAAEQHERLWRGRYAFLQRQRLVNPDPLDAPRGRRLLWQVNETALAGHLLFLGDTRSERSARDPASILAARIMGDGQAQALLKALTAWQARAPGALKFIATPSMLLPRRLHTAEGDHPVTGAGTAAALRSDAWCGYPGSLHRLLASLVQRQVQVQGCVFLSGDEHIGCAARITVQAVDDRGHAAGQALRLWSVHAGALYAPYPFANAQAADFAASETFYFQEAGQRYRCQVDAFFPGPGDGFVELTVQPARTATGRDGLAVRFCSAAGPAADQCWAVPAED